MPRTAPRARSTALVAGLFTLVTGAGLFLAGSAGFAPVPGAVAAVAALVFAASLGWAATPLLVAAHTAAFTPPTAPPADQDFAPSPTTPVPRDGLTTRRPISAVPVEGTTTRRPAPPGATPRTRTPAEPPGVHPADAAPAEPPPRHPAGAAPSKPPLSRPAGAAPAEPPPRHPAGAAMVKKGPRSHRRPALASPLRSAIVAAAVVLLGLVCWIRPGEPGRVLFTLLQSIVGLLAYALPLLPLLALVPAGPRTPVPWRVLWRNRKALALGTAVARTGRDALLGRAAGLLVATGALFHLLRGQPGLEESAYRLAGGLLGMVAATPLAGVFSPAGAVGVLLAVLVGVATVTAGHLYRPLGRYPAIAALVVLVVAPVAAGGVTNRVGYRHYLGADGDRVVVIAGLSPHHRHETHDATVALADVPAPMHPLLRKGFPVADRADGVRVAIALADPARAAADGFPDSGLTLRTGECFSFVGGTSNFRYTVPCNGEHTGEVFYIGRLPFAHDPGRDVRAAAARGACEKAFGGYLGAPYGTSYLPMEPPVVRGDLVACLFAALGPWPLRGTRTVAALQQPLDWSPGPGCTVEPGQPATGQPGQAGQPATGGQAGLRITAGQPGQVCVAPGRAVTAAGPAPLTVDAEFQPLGRAAGNGRVGVACVGADAVTGYYATVGGDGTLVLSRQQGTARAPLGTAGKARSSPSAQTAVTQVQLTCRQDGAAVQLVAAAGKGRELTVTDAQGVTTLSPRLVVEAAEAPVTATVTLFSAKLI